MSENYPEFIENAEEFVDIDVDGESLAQVDLEGSSFRTYADPDRPISKMPLRTGVKKGTGYDRRVLMEMYDILSWWGEPGGELEERGELSEEERNALENTERFNSSVEFAVGVTDPFMDTGFNLRDYPVARRQYEELLDNTVRSGPILEEEEGKPKS